MKITRDVPGKMQLDQEGDVRLTYIMHAYFDEVESYLRSIPRQIPEGIPEAYVGGGQSRLNYLGLKMPAIDRALKHSFSFSKLPEKEQAKIWTYVWNNSQNFETMAVAVGWFILHRKKGNVLKFWALLKTWAKRLDNWAHSDSLSSLYAACLEEAPEKVFPQLVKWNKSANPWFRRQSLVSLIYYSSQRERFLPFKKMIPLVEAQLDYDHYYVQKGVGWTLRELGNVYPKETEAFMLMHLPRISSVAFTAAIEKLPDGKKTKLKNLRKKFRQKKR